MLRPWLTLVINHKGSRAFDMANSLAPDAGGLPLPPAGEGWGGGTFVGNHSG
jgi:hypothetical protein